jgi:hypothetical protein
MSASIKWIWDRSAMRYRALVEDGDPAGPCELLAIFHKVGGRWSKGDNRSYWTISVDSESLRYTHYNNADAAKEAAVAEMRRRASALEARRNK